MPDFTIRPNFLEGSRGMEEYIEHARLHGIYSDKSGKSLRALFNGQRKRTIMGIFDAANITRGIATGHKLYQNPGPVKNNVLMEKLPPNSYVTRTWYENLIQPVSATDAGTIALGILTDDVAGLLGAIAIDDTTTAQVDTVTLTGTVGTANITVAGLTLLATFNASLTQTTADFVSTHGAALTAVGITVADSVADLSFTADVAGRPFTSPVTVGVITNLDGSTVNTTANVSGPFGLGVPITGIQDDAIANFSVKTTGYRDIVADVAVEALTAGKIVVYVEYVQTTV